MTPDLSTYHITTDDAAKLGLPSWAVGRTFGAVAQLADQLYQKELNAYRAPPAPPPTAPPAPTDGPPTADDWSLDPGDAARRHAAWLEREAERKLSNSLGGLYTQNAATALNLVRSRETDAFSRWGPEIAELINAIPVQQRTAESLGLAVEIVKGRHAKEIADTEIDARVNAKLEQLVAAGSVIRPTSGSPSIPGAPVLDYNIEDLPANYRELLESQRLIRDGRLTNSAHEFFEKFKRPGQSTKEFVKEWFDAAKKGDVVFAQTGRGLTVEDA